MTQTLEDRIKELCAKAVTTPASPELEEILAELKGALREHTEGLRKITSNYLARQERRSKED
jgi:hypothetical protein